jgi:hypothetical protein
MRRVLLLSLSTFRSSKEPGPTSLFHFDPVFAEIVPGSGITDLPPNTHDGGRAARMAEPQE